jgi:pyruvate/2-oxoglutarate dehydrogenase complex dihydrolipoamide acyltransferase (E2) component
MGRGKFFSRSDGTYLKKIDPFMRFFPYIMKGRNESAIYFRQQIDITDLKVWLNERNRAAAASGEGVKSTLFHAVLAALVKIVNERPQINRFVIGRRVYQRHELSIAFVIKREFKDDSNEEIAVMKFSPDETLSSISQRIQDEVKNVRQKAKEDEITRHGIVNWFNYLMSMPRILLRGLVRFLAWLDYHGWLPRFFIELDPMHSSIFVSNLGSLGVDAPFHHLYEWGTTSVFMTIGVAEKVPAVASDGSIAVRDVVNIAFTIDERISDGYYFARSMKRFRYFLERPEELEKPAKIPEK